MDAPRNVGILPDGCIDGLPEGNVRAGDERPFIGPSPGPVLFMGGCTYAAAYLVLGLSGLSTFSGVLALAGTVMILFGLRKTWQRA